MGKLQEGSIERTTKKPTTLDHILEGRAKITYNGQDGGFLQDRKIGGKNWHGKTFAYALEVPKQTNPDEVWETELRVWDPLPISQGDYVTPPPTQLYILTGQGEMQFSKDQGIVNAIIKEIHRQLDAQQKSKEKK